MRLYKNGFEIEASPSEVFELMRLIDEASRPVVCDTKAAPDPKPAKAKGKKNRPDIGKVKAQRSAGWPMAKVADEFGVSEQTIRNWLKEVEA